MARFDGGWVKLYRKAVLGDIGSSFIRSGLWSTLMCIANIQPSKVAWNGKPRALQRGEIATSLSELANLGEVDVKTVNRHLNYLALRGTIKYEKSSTGTIITILNYEQYQGVDADGPKQGPNDREDEVQTDALHIEERKNKRKKEATAAVFKISSNKDLVALLSTDIQSLYSVEYILRESIKAWDWCTDNPHKTPKSDTGFRRFFKSWLERGWEDYRKSLPSNKTLALADSWESAAQKVLTAIQKFSAGDNGVQEFLGDLFPIVCKVNGGLSSIRQMPRNDFTVKKIAGMLKEASLRVNQEVG